MNLPAKSLRPFIGSKDFDVSRSFYTDLGFKESVIDHHLSLFELGATAFYLQRAYVKDWIENTMLFMFVDDAYEFFEHLQGLQLDQKYADVRVLPVKKEVWGEECFVIDPSGILWHFGRII
ncbi:glyoxalase [Pedobacter sp. MR2016-24]|uniref:glyoxalase n=1 Tax=Pedobacter sp. MR2016-24 TaxID=2994466 RepID=UPI0022456032|nr:glyoxalase [Pedobacter sp. MR2016-24]MCX2483457.1 glyoxalase [Pedobacter sp. MR2016-24]